MSPSRTMALYLTTTMLICVVWHRPAATAVRNRPYHIGLFSNGGWYSHDALTSDLAKQLANSGYKVTVIDMRLFNINSTIYHNGNFSVLQYQHESTESSRWLRRLQNRMWLDTIPISAGKLSKLKNLRFFMSFYDVHFQACHGALNDHRFMRSLMRLKLDLLVVDCILNECGLAMSALLAVPRVYMSNYPIVEQYADYAGVLANPAYVPSIFSKEVGQLRFVARTVNFIYRALSAFVRNRLLTRVHNVFASHGYNLPNLHREERSNVFYGTPFERLLDTPRPTSNNFKYFGCSDCLEETDHKPPEVINFIFKKKFLANYQTAPFLVGPIPTSAIPSNTS
ncbi:unnamed protein product [Soboliphyme baturini]|uniref:glucuronosyltransferase n=1 Tax=Soboliphyme baturini TaxID=241478 RepID=A0A183IMT6_9BILA|nr:unnamed protein product [Soboliphyme baturini]